MAEVALQIGGRTHVVACRAGEEAQMQALGRRLDAHSASAQRAAGAAGGERTMLFIALMLADQLAETERTPGGGTSGATLDRLAETLEALADSLEKDAPSA